MSVMILFGTNPADRVSESERLARDPHDDLVQILYIAKTALPLAQVFSDPWFEFDGPMTDTIVRDINAALQQYFLNLAQAQAEPDVHPNRVRDDPGQKAVVIVADAGGSHLPQICPVPETRNRINFGVTSTAARPAHSEPGCQLRTTDEGSQINGTLSLCTRTLRLRLPKSSVGFGTILE